MSQHSLTEAALAIDSCLAPTRRSVNAPIDGLASAGEGDDDGVRVLSARIQVDACRGGSGCGGPLSCVCDAWVGPGATADSGR